MADCGGYHHLAADDLYRIGWGNLPLSIRSGRPTSAPLPVWPGLRRTRTLEKRCGGSAAAQRRVNSGSAWAHYWPPV